MRIDGYDRAGSDRGQEINIRKLSYRKAIEKKRIPDNFDDIVGSDQEEEKSGHESNSRRLTGPNIKELPKFNRQRAKGHTLFTFRLSSLPE